jgi:hypothetical protein
VPDIHMSFLCVFHHLKNPCFSLTYMQFCQLSLQLYPIDKWQCHLLNLNIENFSFLFWNNCWLTENYKVSAHRYYNNYCFLSLTRLTKKRPKLLTSKMKADDWRNSSWGRAFAWNCEALSSNRSTFKIKKKKKPSLLIWWTAKG